MSSFKNLEFHAIQMRANGKRSRSAKEEILDTFYIINAEIEIYEDSINKFREKLGRFILTSNDLKIDDETMLQYYKD